MDHEARQQRPPYDISAITGQLFIAPRPRAHHVSDVRGLDVDLVISMIWAAPPAELAQPPFTLLRMPTIDTPFTPIPMALLFRGVNAAIPVMNAGGKVLVYCRMGMHRSVAMACCILIARGLSADEAMKLVVDRRPVADPHIYYIERRIRLFEAQWAARPQSPALA